MFSAGDAPQRKRGPEKGSARRGFGRITRQRSGRYTAAYIGPDQALHRAPSSYEAKMDAEGWLRDEARLIERDEWSAPATRKSDKYARGITVGEYADLWIAGHKRRDGKPIKARTKAYYTSLIDTKIKPLIGDVQMKHLTPELVDDWFSRLPPSTPTLNANAYGVLRTMCTAATRGSKPILKVNPCQMPGAGSTGRTHQIETLTMDELAGLVAALPGKYKMLILLATWCGLRYGELCELRRKDVIRRSKILRISRGVVKVGGEFVVSTTKTGKGRDVAVPPHIWADLLDHIAEHAEAGPEGLLFPAAKGGHLSQSSMFKVYDRARTKIDRKDLRFHDLRHTGLTLAAQAGATLAELMQRAGHSTPQAAMIYQHAARGRDAQIAALLSKMAEGQ